MMFRIPTSLAYTPLDSQDLSNRVFLYGTIHYDAPVSGEVIEFSNPAPMPSPVEEIQVSLNDRDPIPTLSSLELSSQKSPFLDRMEKATVLLLASGNGVFFNIDDRDMAKNNLTANAKNPIGRFREGWTFDSDSFTTNFIIHPALWFSYATYLKSKGASDKEALIVTQAANLLWEGVMEGAYVPPSGKDLLTDLLSSVAGIYLYNKGPGKAIAEKFLKVERWAARHNMKLIPAFYYNPYTRGGRAESRLLIYIR